MQFGHNEVDEPSFTQPVMYENVRSRASVVDLYERKLRDEGLLKAGQHEALVTRLQSHLQRELDAAAAHVPTLVRVRRAVRGRYRAHTRASVCGPCAERIPRQVGRVRPGRGHVGQPRLG